MTEICTTLADLYQSVYTNSAANNFVVVSCWPDEYIRHYKNKSLYKTRGLNRESACSFKYQCPVSSSGEKRHPHFEIMKDQLEFL